MKQLRSPGLGPIVGHTTDNTARLWIRAYDPADEGAELARHRRSLGVVAVVKRNGRDVASTPAYFRLHREFDRTGTFLLGADRSIGGQEAGVPLEPDTEYEVALGTLTIDDPYDDDEQVSDEVLADRLPALPPLVRDLAALGPESRATFRTFPRPEQSSLEQLSFLLGSCRYPGLLWQRKRSDQVFGPMLTHLRGGGAARFVLMIGDQIYGDLYNRKVPIGRADTFGEFQSRYVDAFGSRNMRELLRSAPHYMILDDHEIEDNWTQDRLRKAGKHALFNVAIGTYLSYQWSHGPRTWGRKLYYHFECGGYPFFVLDTRTQRTKDSVVGLEDNHLLGRPGLHPDEPSQLDCLLRWLKQQHDTFGDRPKFIVTSSVFVPNDMAERQGPKPAALDPKDPKIVQRLEQSDAWPAYPNTRRAVLSLIVQHHIQNVVFLSGDVHCSNLASLKFSRAGADLGLHTHCVTSSAFYWPFPFADGNPSDFVHDSRAQGQEDTFRVSDDVDMDYAAWNFVQEDNFSRLTLNRAASELRVDVFDSDGKPLRGGGPGQATQRLALAPWT